MCLQDTEGYLAGYIFVLEGKNFLANTCGQEAFSRRRELRVLQVSGGGGGAWRWQNVAESADIYWSATVDRTLNAEMSLFVSV